MVPEAEVLEMQGSTSTYKHAIDVLWDPDLIFSHFKSAIGQWQQWLEKQWKCAQGAGLRSSTCIFGNNSESLSYK